MNTNQMSAEGHAASAFAERPLKPLFVAHGPNKLNGPNVWLTRLLPALVERGFAPHLLVLSTAESCSIFEPLRESGVRVEFIGWDYTDGLMRTIAQYANTHGCDLLMANLNVAAHFTAPYFKAAGLPTVSILHSDDVFYREIAEEFMVGQDGRYLSAMVVVSKFLYENYKALPIGPCRLVHSTYGAPIPSQQTSYSKDPFRFLYVGRLVDEQKRITDVVNAMIVVLQRNPEAEFWIAGEGSERPAVDELIEQAQLGKRIRMLGGVHPASVPKLYAVCQSLVLLSDYEGLSIALMEAMSYGIVPICTYTRSGIDEIVLDGQTGLLVPDRGESFQAAAKSLIQDKKLWRTCSQGAAGIVARQFSSRNNADQWAQLFRDLVAQAGPRRRVELPETITLPPIGTDPLGLAREDRRRVEVVAGVTVPPALQTRGEPTAAGAEPRAEGPREVDPSDLPVLLVRSHEFNYSETFLEDHVAHISQNLTLLYGWPFPRFTKGGVSVLKPSVEKSIQAVISGGKITAETWHAYISDLARFIVGSGVKAALLESGLMGSFLHEACTAAKVPFVVHFHGVDAFGRELLERWLPHYRKFFATAHRVVGVSHAMCAQLVALGAPKERVLHAPYGVAVNLPSLARPAEAAPQFVAVGRFVEKKAPLNTVQAFARVWREVPEARLVMIGDGPLLATCQQWAQANGIADAVTFAGVQTREEVSRHMAASRCFVQHSVVASNGDSEGLPLAVLEAGAHGLPVVSTRHAGIPDAVIEGEHGYLVAEGDVAGMAAAMLRFARDPALAARLGAAYRERVVAQFSRKVSIERLQRLLAEAADQTDDRCEAESKVQERVAAELAGAEAAVAAAREAGNIEAEAEALQRWIGLDRLQVPAYARLGDLLHEAGDEAGAYMCYREGRRLGGLTDEAAQLLTRLEAGAAGASELAQTYREQIGEGEVGRTEKPHRILVVTNLFPPQELGGYGRTMWEFCDLLVRRGHEVKVLTSNSVEWTRPFDPGMDRLESRVERTIGLFGTWKGGAAVLTPDWVLLRKIASENTRVIKAAIQSFKPDRVMAGNIDFVGYEFIRDCLAQKLPVLHRLGNGDAGYAPDPSLESPFFCLAGNTEWLNRRLQEKGYKAGHWSVVYPGSPLEHYYRAFPPRFDRLRIAYASIFAPFKGPHILFEALGILARAGVDFTLECAGEQPDPFFKTQCEQIALRGGFTGRVRWHGFINRAGLASMFSRCNTLVFPSVFEEPFGKTQIEAMAAGLAVVSSGTGGTGEIVKHQVNGLLFKSKDAADLARQLQSLPLDPERWARLASQGQADAYRFTTGESVRRIEKFFDSSFPA
ncbi:MAG: glycosyltransferase [Verrucomicrobia bacterium]|nr:glycosyltransferase [Verrucomicrobiota bacterium]